MEHELVGQLTVAGLGKLLDEKLANVATKMDVSILSNQIDVLKQENESLREEVRSLKSNEKKVMDKLVDLEARSRRNNLIFRGLKVTPQTKDYKQLVIRFCNEKFGMASTLWVNRAHPLDKDRTAIIAHFPDDYDILHIMSQVRELKGTGFSVYRDFPREVRYKRGRLAAIRAEVERVAGRRRMPMTFDHLVINGSRFTWEDEKLMAGAADGAEKLHQMFNHDFSQFLSSLKENVSPRTSDRGPDSPPSGPTSETQPIRKPTYATAAAGSSPPSAEVNAAEATR